MLSQIPQKTHGRYVADPIFHPGTTIPRGQAMLMVPETVGAQDLLIHKVGAVFDFRNTGDPGGCPTGQGSNPVRDDHPGMHKGWQIRGLNLKTHAGWGYAGQIAGGGHKVPEGFRGGRQPLFFVKLIKSHDLLTLQVALRFDSGGFEAIFEQGAPRRDEPPP